jgi:hypothetical protein
LPFFGRRPQEGTSVTNGWAERVWGQPGTTISKHISNLELRLNRLNKKGVLFKDFKPNSGANLVPRLEMRLETKKGLKEGFL